MKPSVPTSLLLLMLTASVSPAATYVVRPDGSGDFSTIQQAVNAAGPGGIVELTAGTFTGPGNRDIAIQQHDLLIRSQNGDPANCTIDCQNAGRGFSIAQAATGTRLEGITIAHGYVSFAWGGGVLDISEDGAAVTDCVFYHNYAQSGGGGVASMVSPVVVRCRFVENSAYYGGGFEGGSPGAMHSPVIDHCEFFGNTAVSGGGAIGLETFEPGRHAAIQYCTFARNTAEDGAAISVASQSPLIDHCTFAGNAATLPRACGVITCGTGAAISNCIFALSPAGSAISCFGGTPTLTCCDIFGNAGGDWVGCIAGQLGQNGNFAGNPLFCGVSADDFELRTTSPCTPENNLECGLVGAWPVGCDGPVPVRVLSWGLLKRLYK